MCGIYGIIVDVSLAGFDSNESGALSGFYFGPSCILPLCILMTVQDLWDQYLCG